jgi:IclR family acetate operon transcriptional repressor
MAEREYQEVAPQVGGVQSVERALDLLEALAEARGELGISELALATGQPAGTAHRLLATLAARGYVRRGARGRRYALGPAARALGARAARIDDLAALAPPFLRRMVELSGETANMVALDGDRAVYIAQVPCARSLRTFTEIGNRVPLHCTGCGKVLLAHLSDERIGALLDVAGLTSYTAHTIVSPAAMREELREIRRRGYAVDDEEFEEGVRCLAVPLFDPHGHLAAALSVSGPASRLSRQRAEDLAAAILGVSAAFTDSLAAGQERPQEPEESL